MSQIIRPPFTIADLAGESVSIGDLRLTAQPELILKGVNGTEGSYGSVPELVNPMWDGVMEIEKNVGNFSANFGADSATTGFVEIPLGGYYHIQWQVFVIKASGTISASSDYYIYMDIDRSTDNGSTWVNQARSTFTIAGRTDFLYKFVSPAVILELDQSDWIRPTYTVNAGNGSSTGWFVKQNHNSEANAAQTKLRIWRVG
jgi:hypothetical protein